MEYVTFPEILFPGFKGRVVLDAPQSLGGDEADIIAVLVGRNDVGISKSIPDRGKVRHGDI